MTEDRRLIHQLIDLKINFAQITLWIALVLLLIGFVPFGTSDLQVSSIDRWDSLFPAAIMFLLATCTAIVQKIERGIDYKALELFVWATCLFSGMGLFVWSLFEVEPGNQQALSGVAGTLIGWGTGLPIGDFVRNRAASMQENEASC